MSTKEALINLKGRMYKTKSARFRADQRLRDQNKLAQFSLMFLSVYLMAVSMGKNFGVNYFSENTTDFWSAVCSIAVLGISSLEAGNDRTARAFRLHENAQKIGSVWGKAARIDENTCTDQEYKDLLKEYEDIIIGCDFNHAPVDYWQARMDDRALPWNERVAAGIRYAGGIFIANGFYWFAIVAPPVIFFTLHLSEK